MKFLSFIAAGLVLASAVGCQSRKANALIDRLEAAETTAITAIEGEMTPVQKARLHSQYQTCREAKEPILAVGAAIDIARRTQNILFQETNYTALETRASNEEKLVATLRASLAKVRASRMRFLSDAEIAKAEANANNKEAEIQRWRQEANAMRTQAQVVDTYCAAINAVEQEVAKL